MGLIAFKKISYLATAPHSIISTFLLGLLVSAVKDDGGRGEGGSYAAAPA